MRQLHLIGMAPPSPNPGVEQRCLQAALLPPSLVALDPRHGVFPNLVMTPLMATLFHLYPQMELVEQFMRQISEILADESSRRFNVLVMPQGDDYELDPRTVERIAGIDPAKDLWAVFGIWSISAILWHLLEANGQMRISRKQLKNFSQRFLRLATCVADELGIRLGKLPECITPLPGLYFRLFSDPDLENNGMVCVLQRTLSEMRVPDWRIAQIIPVLRSLVPLPHNEAYNNQPFGQNQNCFMLGCDPAQIDPRRNAEAPIPREVFWRYMGARIRDRLLDSTHPVF